MAVPLLAVLVLAASGYDCFWDHDSQPDDRVLWHSPGIGWALAAFDSASVYFPGMHHELVALDRQSGMVRWERRTPYVATCPSLDTAITYGRTAVMAAGAVVTMDDALFAFDARTGQLRWTFRPPVCLAEGSLPASDGNTIYVGAAQGRVYAISGTSGVVIWEQQFLTGPGVVAYSPVIAKGVLFAEFNISVSAFPFDSGGVVALDAASGSVKWIRYFTRSLPNSPPQGTSRVAVSGSRVVAASNDGLIYAFDVATGASSWQAPRVNSTAVGDLRPLAASGSRVFVGSNTGSVVALDTATGAELWRLPNSGSAAALQADAQSLYAWIGFSSLAAIDEATGQIRWRAGLTSGGQVEILTPGATVDSDRLYAGANDGFYALRSK